MGKKRIHKEYAGISWRLPALYGGSSDYDAKQNTKFSSYIHRL